MVDVETLIDALDKALRQWRMHYEMRPECDDDGCDIHQDQNAEADLFRYCVSALAKAKG